VRSFARYGRAGKKTDPNNRKEDRQDCTDFRVLNKFNPYSLFPGKKRLWPGGGDGLPGQVYRQYSCK
jgi:hypothetical protein